MEKTYHYPDINDKLTKTLIKTKEPYANYWQTSEKTILKEIEERIKNHPMSSCSWLLDAGCGTGRLLPEFQKYFSQILAIDPDCTQIEKAKQTVRNHGFEDKVTFKVASAEQLEWEKESIDVILLSHIIQHVSTDTIQKILSRFHEILKQNGLLFLMTTHSRKNNDYYVKEMLVKSRVVERRVNEQEFNSLINNTQNILPVHFFSKKNITTVLAKNGFKVLDFRTYHILSRSKLLALPLNRDDAVNATDQMKTKSGRDILLISHKI